MKKFLKIILTIILSTMCFACVNNVNANQASNETNATETSDKIVENTGKNDENQNADLAEENVLNTKIKNLCNKEIVKKSYDGKNISSQMKDTINGLSDAEKENFKKAFPTISLDESNFENDEKTYVWISDTLKTILKDSINNGKITQQQIDDILAENQVYLTLMGISIPNIKIEPGISDENVEKLAITLVDIADRVMDPMVLKLIGINAENVNIPETLINLMNSF